VPLGKPPLIEVWLSFRFEPAAGAPPWTRDRYKAFIDAVAAQFPNADEMTRRAVQVSSFNQGGSSKWKGRLVEEVMAIRTKTEDNFRTLQLTPDELTVNFIPGENNPYPGFHTFLDEAMRHCEQYSQCYQPVGLAEAAVHYVDMIEIPIPESRILRTEDYLKLNFDAPEDVFGRFSAFQIQAIVSHPGDDQPVEFVFKTEPRGPEAEVARFRLEWHTPARTGSRMNFEETRSNLVLAHDRLKKCFRSSFTDKGWALFDPQET
jgi:uncharacterized protein (TIGR04255 family)